MNMYPIWFYRDKWLGLNLAYIVWCVYNFLKGNAVASSVTLAANAIYKFVRFAFYHRIMFIMVLQAFQHTLEVY